MLFDRMKDVIAKWEPYRTELLEAIENTHGTHTEDDVLAMILAGKLTLWGDENGAFVTEIIEYPQKRVVNFFLVGGAREKMRELENGVIQDAKTKYGCNRAQGGGRKGWTRVLPDYQEGGYFMYKDI